MGGRVLVERLAGGDETALVDLYDRYAGFVYGLAMRTLTERQAAEDITQEVFVSVWEHPERIEPGAEPCAASSGRYAPPCGRRRPPRGGAAPPRRRAGTGAGDVPDVAEAVLRSDTTGKVRTALDVLPDAQRGLWSWPTSTGTPTGRSPTCWGYLRAQPSRGYAWRRRIAENLDPEMSEQPGRWA